MGIIGRILLSIGVIIAFIAYSWHQRNENNPSAAIPPPSSTPDENTQTVKTKKDIPLSYKDGNYTGPVTDAYYGFIQVQAVIKNGKLADVIFLEYPDDQANSIYINKQAMPYLKQEAIKAQDADVNVISGATDTSEAFVQSLTEALSQAEQS